MRTIENEMVEELAKNDGRKVMHYRVKVNYRKAPEDTDFPETIQITRGEYDPVQNRPLTSRTEPLIPVAPPSGGLTYANMSTDGHEILQRVGGLTDDVARAIVDGRRSIRIYRTIDDVTIALMSQSRMDPLRRITALDPAGRPVELDALNLVIARLNERRLKLN
jgi:hypothetical protein